MELRLYNRRRCHRVRPSGLVSNAAIIVEPNKPTIACEPMVSSLTEVAKLLQPGRCVT